MNDEQKRKNLLIEAQLRIIQLAIHELAKLLPDEQKFLGSELQRMEELKNILAHKYLDSQD